MTRSARATGLLFLAACGGATAPVVVKPLAPVDAPRVASAAPTLSESASSGTVASATASPPPAPSGPMLSTTHFTTFIWRKPMYEKDGMIGAIRAGAHVPRAAEPYAGKDAGWCKGKWYAVEPVGYVCVGGDGVTLDLDDRTVVAAAAYPPKAEPLPFGYGMSFGAPLYGLVPTPEEQKASEGDVGAWQKQLASMRAKSSPANAWPETALPLGPMPSFLEGHARVPATMPGYEVSRATRVGFADSGVRLAFSAAFESEGRAFYLTSESVVVPADRVKAASPSDFHGIELGGTSGEKLPIVWARYSSDTKIVASVYKLTSDGATKTDASLPYHAHAAIEADDVTVKGAKYHVLSALPAGVTAEAGAKYAVKSTDVARVDGVTTAPDKVGDDEVWIDVHLYTQTMVVYRGTTPIFATLVSSGQGGKTHSTPWGAFHVYQKHTTSRMEAPEKPPETEKDKVEHAYRYDDVPYVQYLVGGIAIHAAFWHDGFGMPRSHGCINVSPRDAQYLFGVTLPAMPRGWHSIFPGHTPLPAGSLVVVHG
jgi:lipoprotein-anchoring transpeptidase ErfK/SrfK